MSRLSVITATRIVLGLGLVCFGVGLVQARPKRVGYDKAAYNSTSNLRTARLKYDPPRNWIRHYLGDDRYKIAGQVWTVATTHQDTYYHRFTCPNMLRQSPNLVIGFFSPALAAEAGYQPDPTCQPQASSFVYIGPGRVSGAAGGPVTTINRGRTARRIVLADRVSTVLLPPNWRRTQSGAQTLVGQSTLADTLQPLRGTGSIRISFVRAPANLPVDVSRIFNAKTFPVAVTNLSGGQANIAANISVTDSRLGGINGITIVPKPGAKVPHLTGRALAAARGKKIYVIEDRSGNTPGASTIISSFRPR